MTDARRKLPSVNTLLDQASAAGLGNGLPRPVLTGAVRAVLNDARAAGGVPTEHDWMNAVERQLALHGRRSLSRVINATGVILHTNLGRAPLAAAARAAAMEASGYSALEYDIQAGERGTRQQHTARLLTEITGAEDALAVNNAASALFLALNTFAREGETVVSRGELIEIGGGFRIPDILARSGSVLVEVGTTNRTRVTDYELAISARTRCLLKAHRSNFTMNGFVSEAPVDALVQLAAPRGIPVVYDVGSGLLIDLSEFGLRGEPLVSDSVAAGAVTIFSGDKLMGGPQAGIAVGRAEMIEAMKRNPLARALRPDKVTLAALEATLSLYLDRDIALSNVPVLAMLIAEPNALKRRARRLARRIPGASLEQGNSAVGGGAFPHVDLPTTLVAIEADSPDSLLAALRRHTLPVIARAAGGRVLIDVRTVADDEFAELALAIETAQTAPAGS